ncbi:MAG: hypothetical protein K6U74_06560 [Firmicutes bacterium]|nr:hypothetical protein [Bacillota bacterium]
MVAANNTATSYPDGWEVQGESFVAYPDGYTLLSCGRKPGVYYFDLDLSRVNKVRQRWPYLEDVRSNGESIYRKYYSKCFHGHNPSCTASGPWAGGWVPGCPCFTVPEQKTTARDNVPCIDCKGFRVQNKA